MGFIGAEGRVCRYCSWRELGHALVALDGGMGSGEGRSLGEVEEESERDA